MCTLPPTQVCAGLAGAAQALRDEMAYVLRWPYEAELLNTDAAVARATLGDDEFDAAFANGRSFDEEGVVVYAERGRVSASGQSPGGTG
jgi:hypothetical protein